MPFAWLAALRRPVIAAACAAFLVYSPGVAGGPAPAASVQEAVAPASPAALAPAELSQTLDALVRAHAAVNGFTGSVMLAHGGAPLFEKGYGFANAEWRIPNTPDTRFRIGSITKQFTSMLIMQLREQKKLALDDSVCAYVADCPPAWKAVTIHHLLTHTSGIPSYTSIESWRKTNMVPKTVDEMITIFRDLPLQWTPGDQFAYNNSGYFLLGAVIERASGMPYEQALREMILTPIGMTDTGYDWSKTILERRASGYTGRGDAIENAAALDMQQPYSAGSMYSTVVDLVKWDQELRGESLIPDAAKTLMWTPVRNGYAYGWSIAPASPATFGHTRVAHSGGINGFSSIIVRVPASDVVAIVLSNNDTVNAGAIARDMLAVYYGQPYTLPSEKVAATVDPAVYDAYAGRYQLAPQFIITVRREGSRLMAQATGQGAFEIFPQSDAVFFAKVTELTITFEKDASGKVTHLMLRQGGADRRAPKIE